MKIKRVTLEVRDAVLCSSDNKDKVDFSILNASDKLKEIRIMSPRTALNVFKKYKICDPIVVNALLKRNPSIIEYIKRPTPQQLGYVLETHPHALNKLAASKRTEELVIQAIRPERKYLIGPRDDRASNVIKNVVALHPNTSFTPRVYHEIAKLVLGANARIIKKLMATFEKQKRKVPEDFHKMISRNKCSANEENSEIVYSLEFT